MEPIFLLYPILGLAGCLAVAGRKAWLNKKVLKEERHRRVLQNLHAALSH